MTTVRCSIHPGVLATVKVGSRDRGWRYLCGDCLRTERPILYVTLPMEVT